MLLHFDCKEDPIHLLWAVPMCGVHYAKYYFSDAYKKKSYRSLNNIENKINTYSEKLPILEDDTKNIIEYVEQTNNKKKKKFNFWKLLENNE